ncbi:MAG: glycosyltransferase family 39 protein, partial [Chitinispirillaceae bacterium]
MNIRDEIKSIRPGFWVFTGLLFVLLYFLNASWFKWGNLIIDSYRDAWLAENLLKGKLLYKDLFCEYGFLPYYLLACVFKFFGSNGISMVFCGIAVTAAVSFFLYKTARLFFDEVVSGLAVFTFLTVFAFGNYQQTGIFNFILPYSIAATIFCLFCTASLYYLCRSIISDEIIWLKVWSALYGFTFLCRPDIPLVCWAGTAVALLPVLWQTRHKKVLIFSCLFAPLFFALVSYAVFFSITGSLPDFYQHVIRHGMVVKSNTFNLTIMGIDKFGHNIITMFISLFMSLLAV